MMLIIQGAANENIHTLSERATANPLSGSQYLVRFISEDGLTETSCIATLSGSYAYRHSVLTVTEKDNATTGERQAGSVSLKPKGFWIYKVYQQNSITNLDYTLSTLQLEEGKCLVKETTWDTQTEYSGSSPSTQVYSG